MNLNEWLGSKKTKNMLVTQVVLMVVGLAVVFMSDGDPEKAKSMLSALQALLAMIAGLGGVTIAGQAAVDVKKESVKAEPAK